MKIWLKQPLGERELSIYRDSSARFEQRTGFYYINVKTRAAVPKGLRSFVIGPSKFEINTDQQTLIVPLDVVNLWDPYIHFFLDSAQPLLEAYAYTHGWSLQIVPGDGDAGSAAREGLRSSNHTLCEIAQLIERADKTAKWKEKNFSGGTYYNTKPWHETFNVTLIDPRDLGEQPGRNLWRVNSDLAAKRDLPWRALVEHARHFQRVSNAVGQFSEARSRRIQPLVHLTDNLRRTDGHDLRCTMQRAEIIRHEALRKTMGDAHILLATHKRLRDPEFWDSLPRAEKGCSLACDADYLINAAEQWIEKWQ